MNLSGRGRAGLSRAGLARIPLRIVLVGTMVLLVLVGLIASGAAVTVTMRAQLIDRVDEQLIAAVEGWVHRPPFGPSPGPAPDELPAPGSAPAGTRRRPGAAIPRGAPERLLCRGTHRLGSDSALRRRGQ